MADCRLPRIARGRGTLHNTNDNAEWSRLPQYVPSLTFDFSPPLPASPGQHRQGEKVSPAFHHCPRLPTELRQQIIRAALQSPASVDNSSSRMRTHPLAALATVNREWQDEAEAVTFQHINIHVGQYRKPGADMHRSAPLALSGFLSLLVDLDLVAVQLTCRHGCQHREQGTDPSGS